MGNHFINNIYIFNMSMEMNCGTQTYHADCANLSMNWDNDLSYIRLVELAVDMASLGFKIIAGMGSGGLSNNMKKAMNSLRCAVNAMGNNVWTLIASAYWAAKTF